MSATSNLAPLVDSLRPTIVGSRGESERNRCVPPDLIDQVRSMGLFDVLTPAHLGGHEGTLSELAFLLREVARLDGSLAWNLWNGNMGFVGNLLSPEATEAIWGQARRPMIVNSARVTGHAIPVDGGYRLHGRWDLVSGIEHADWVGVFAVVMDGDGPRMVAPGAPEVRVFIVPRRDVTVLDTWHVTGMRGTGSNSVVADGAMVPSALAIFPVGNPADPSPLYRIPPFTLASTGGAAVLAGMAGAAIDEARALVADKASDNGESLASRPRVVTAIARADAQLRAAWHGYLAAIEAVEDEAAGGEVGMGARADLRASMCHLAEVAGEVTGAMYRIGSSASIWSGSRLDQLWRDVTTAAQHGLLNESVYETTGTVLLGGQPSAPVI